MKYENPVILSDYSDPDVIRVGGDFYMVASSFNYVPGVPVLHSKNLVEWELVNYVLKRLPFEKFNAVRHGEGAWAPCIRYRGGRFYCLIPFPDEGIYVSETDDIYGEWSAPRPLLRGKGYEDPCPVWVDGKCLVVFAFCRSRAGFNSKLAVFETDEELLKEAGDYKIIYSEPDISPEIEGPKVYNHGGYYYILAAAGGVKSGWQVALRSESIYGPYKTKIVLTQGDTDVNGPHQGALVDLDDFGEKWAFMHFQDRGAYGRVVHLQPARWENGWVALGEGGYDGLAGHPTAGGEYPAGFVTGKRIEPSDEFENGISPVWQNPANPEEGWYEIKRGLKLNCVYYGRQPLADLPQMLLQKVQYKNFAVSAKCKLSLKEDGDETGLVIFGKKYAYICVVRRDGQNFLELREGEIGGDADRTLARSQPYSEDGIIFKISAKYEDLNKLSYKVTFGKVAFTHKFYASPGVWTGARIGIYARSDRLSKGFATFKNFKVTCTDGRLNR